MGAFLPWLASNAVPLIGGLLGAGGQVHANNSSRAIAREQMAFQERMSNTSFQRSREDMIRAGINPAMMHHTGGASTPGGAAASVGNVGGAGMSSARDAAMLGEQVKQMKAQTRIAEAEAGMKEIELNSANTSDGHAPNLGALLMMRRRAEFDRLGYDVRGFGREFEARGRDIEGRSQELQYLRELYPAMLREHISRALLSELAQPEARAMSDFYRKGGAFIPALGLLTNTASSVAGSLSGLSRAASAARTSRGMLRPVEEYVEEAFGQGYRSISRFRRQR